MVCRKNLRRRIAYRRYKNRAIFRILSNTPSKRKPFLGSGGILYTNSKYIQMILPVRREKIIGKFPFGFYYSDYMRLLIRDHGFQGYSYLPKPGMHENCILYRHKPRDLPCPMPHCYRGVVSYPTIKSKIRLKLL